MDFFKINAVKRRSKSEEGTGFIEVYPTFIVCKSKDLMTRGKAFYAIWDEEAGLWSTDFFRAVEIMDDAMDKFVQEKYADAQKPVIIRYLRESDSGSIDKFNKFVQKQVGDNYHPLDKKIFFAGDNVKKTDYASRKLSYNLEDAPCPAWDELVSTLYSDEERHKIEWAIGSVVTGDSKKLQKFFVFYGSGGTGKSTILNVIQQLFEGYSITFRAKDLGSASNTFALEQFKSNPLIAIDHEGELSKINDNSRLNAIVSHDEISINEKFKAQYTMKLMTLLFIGTNKPVKITDAKSGLIRRLIDIHPTGDKIPTDRYFELTEKIKFELGAIAKHCMDVYLENKRYYDKYTPNLMMGLTNDFYNFVMDNYTEFSKMDNVTVKYGWSLYKSYCEEANVKYILDYKSFKSEFRNYFRDYKDRAHIAATDENVYGYCMGFKKELFQEQEPEKKAKPDAVKQKPDIPGWLQFKEQDSRFDQIFADSPAQYAVEDERTGQVRPEKKWSNCNTKLHDIDTKQLHYVKTPENLIMIDLDIKGEDGKKNFEKNAKAASVLPETYAELSKSGEGIHCYYYYTGNVKDLSSLYSENVEIKTFPDDKLGAIRRKLTKCNDIPIATINSGLPLKEKDRKMVNKEAVWTEEKLRTLILNVINKSYPNVPGTASGISLINKALDEAYESGAQYDVSNLKQRVMKFAEGSTNQMSYCVSTVSSMKFKSEDISVVKDEEGYGSESRFVFFDFEVFKNCLILCYLPLAKSEYDKIIKKGKKELAEFVKTLTTDNVQRMINPTPQQVQDIFDNPNNLMIGFNCRRYDNHIAHARINGYSNEECYKLSHAIVNDIGDSFFRSAWDRSYLDLYDMCKTKISLKKWEIKLGMYHLENEYDWDAPLDKSHWDEVAQYCANDVIATEGVFLVNHGDYTARLILSALSGLNANSTNNSHSARIIFGADAKKHHEFVYTDFRTGQQYGPGVPFQMPLISWDEYEKVKDDWKTQPAPHGNCFPGYFFVRSDDGKLHNMYRGIDLGFGGYVYAAPGMYISKGKNGLAAETEDVASEHPHSIKELNLFGKYTQNFVDLMNARIFIKHHDYESAKKLFDGKLAPYLTNDDDADALSGALKIVINSVYGLTSAKFDNPFRDSRNVNNIVALRGALFMKTVQDAVEAKGYKVIHIKTDSIKIAEPDNDILEYVVNLGKQFGYEFEVEHTWDRLCLVNDAVFIGKHGHNDPESPDIWDAVGTQFQVPYVFKTLFSHEPIKFEDMCETKSVEGTLYLDLNEGLTGNPELEKVEKLRRSHKKFTKAEERLLDIYKDTSDEDLKAEIAKGHNMSFIGKVGLFCPIKPGCGGGELLRKGKDRDGNVIFGAANGAKWTENGKEVNRWLEAEAVRKLDYEDLIDRNYYRILVDNAKETIEKYGSIDEFVA